MQEENSSHLTSNQFGERMGQGWKAGLLRLHPGFQLRLNWKIYNLSNSEVGDIDCAVSFYDKKSIVDIFPSMTKFSRSTRIESINSRHFFVEFKRSCQDAAMEKNINQFVSFYTKILNTANRANIKWQLLPKCLKEALRSNDLVIIFVFSGADNVKVERCLRSKIGEKLMIYGRTVVTAWCPSEELIKWEDMQKLAQMEEEIIQLKRSLAEAQQQLPKKKLRIA